MPPQVYACDPVTGSGDQGDKMAVGTPVIGHTVRQHDQRPVSNDLVSDLPVPDGDGVRLGNTIFCFWCVHVVLLAVGRKTEAMPRYFARRQTRLEWAPDFV